MSAAPPGTRAALAADLRRLGLRPGDAVLVHAAMRRLGPLWNGPDAFISALRDAVGAAGTVLAYTDWDARYDRLLDADGRVPDAWRPHVPPFDPAASRAARDNGAFAEFLRTTPGALRSRNPGASVAAIGAGAAHFTAGHLLDYGYGEGSPFARLVTAGGKVLMAGAPHDTMTLLHLAEHLAAIPGKRIRRQETPFADPDGTVWRMVEEFETSIPVAPCLPEDHFARIVAGFRDAAAGRTGADGRPLAAEGTVGAAPALLVDAAAIVRFAIAWLEEAARAAAQNSRPGLMP